MYKLNPRAMAAAFAGKHLAMFHGWKIYSKVFLIERVGDDCDPESSIFFGPQSVCHVLLCTIPLERSANVQSLLGMNEKTGMRHHQR